MAGSHPYPAGAPGPLERLVAFLGRRRPGRSPSRRADSPGGSARWSRAPGAPGLGRAAVCGAGRAWAGPVPVLGPGRSEGRRRGGQTGAVSLSGGTTTRVPKGRAAGTGPVGPHAYPAGAPGPLKWAEEASGGGISPVPGGSARAPGKAGRVPGAPRRWAARRAGAPTLQAGRRDGRGRLVLRVSGALRSAGPAGRGPAPSRSSGPVGRRAGASTWRRGGLTLGVRRASVPEEKTRVHMGARPRPYPAGAPGPLRRVVGRLAGGCLRFGGLGFRRHRVRRALRRPGRPGRGVGRFVGRGRLGGMKEVRSHGSIGRAPGVSDLGTSRARSLAAGLVALWRCCLRALDRASSASAWVELDLGDPGAPADDRDGRDRRGRGRR